MKTQTITKTSIFNASKETVFNELQKLETLQYVAKGFASFTLLNDEKQLLWQPGQVLNFDFYLLGFISFGKHTIKVITFDIDNGVYSEETNKHVPIWNHRIILEESDENKTRYTDEVEIYAGWKTIFVAFWAKLFYTHRQKRWKNLLKENN